MSESVAVVTGASQGIGRASAIRLARDFSAITLVARNLQHLNDTAAKVKAAGAEPLVLDLDLREPASAQTVVSGRWSVSTGSTPSSTSPGQFRRSIYSR